MKGFGVRLSNDNIEAHLTKYNHDTDAENCNRSNFVIGVGPQFSTKDNGESKDTYLTWSPGIAWKLNKTWRDQEVFSLYNRMSVGFLVDESDDHQASLELDYLHYGGFFEPNHGERFLTLGLSLDELEDTDGSNGTDGTDGSNGTDGTDGSNGTDGTDGSNITNVTNITNVINISNTEESNKHNNRGHNKRNHLHHNTIYYYNEEDDSDDD